MNNFASRIRHRRRASQPAVTSANRGSDGSQPSEQHEGGDLASSPLLKPIPSFSESSFAPTPQLHSRSWTAEDIDSADLASELLQIARQTYASSVISYGEESSEDGERQGDERGSNSVEKHGRSAMEYVGMLEWREKEVKLTFFPLHQLDLPASLPFMMSMLRAQILAHLSALEDKIRSITRPTASTNSNPSESSSSSRTTLEEKLAPSDATDDAILSVFYARLTTVKEELKALMEKLPSAPSLPSAPKSMPQIRRTPSQPSVPDLSNVMPDVKLMVGSLYARLPAAPALLHSMKSSAAASSGEKEASGDESATTFLDFQQMLSAIKHNLEAINEVVNSVSRKDCLINAWSRLQQERGEVGEKEVKSEQVLASLPEKKGRRKSLSGMVPSASDLSIAAATASQSTVAFVRRMEERLISLGQEGRNRANSVVARAAEAVLITEDKIYRRALDLAQGGRSLITYADLPEMWKNNGEPRPP